MKKTIYILYVLLIFSVVGCVNDLDMTPIGEETVDVTYLRRSDGIAMNLSDLRAVFKTSFPNERHTAWQGDGLKRITTFKSTFIQICNS